MSARYVFTGYAEDGTTEVRYLLEMFNGTFVGEWRPVATTTVNLTSWEMSIEGTGGVKNIACTGSHEDFPAPFSTDIFLEATS